MLDQLLVASPYFGVLIALLLGSLGAPLPEEIPIVTAGILAHDRLVEWWLVLPVCLAGVIVGDLVLYGAGRRWGNRVLTHPLLARCLTDARRDRLAALYRRHGIVIVVAARHVMGVRAAAFVTAGIVRLPFWRFAVADALAIGVGVSLNFGLAYLFADRAWSLLEHASRIEGWLGMAGVAVAVGCVGLAARRHGTRLLGGGDLP